MIVRIALMIGLAISIVGCGASSPSDSAPTKEPTADISATVAAAVAKAQETMTPPATSTPTPEPTPSATPKPTATPTPAPTATSAPTPSVEWVATPQWMANENDAIVIWPSDLASDLTRDWVMQFTHHDEQYLDQARSAFSYIEDSNFCGAAEKFAALVNVAQDRDGERLTAASYNAGMLYMLVYHQGEQEYCFRLDDSRRRRTLDSSIQYLEYTWRHRPHTAFDAQIAFMLGLAYAYQTEQSSFDGAQPAPAARENAIEFLCLSIEEEHFHDTAEALLDVLEASCESAS